MSGRKSSAKTISKKKANYKHGSINGVRSSSRLAKKKRQQEEYTGLVKMLVGSVLVLLLIFALNAIIRKNFTFNGIYYEEPKESEVVEIVGSSDADEPEERVSLSLVGDLVINLKVGEKYVEPGYTATSDLKGDISNYVKVKGKVDTSKIGSYKLVYVLDYNGISPELTRVVNVNKSSNNTKPTPSSTPKPSSSPSASPSPGVTPEPSPEPEPIPEPSPVPVPSPSPTPVGHIILSLIGDETVYIVEGSSYKDAGAKAIDNKGKDLSNQIKVNGSVNSNVAGTYKITYSINDYSGEVLEVSRNVIVQNMGITLTLDNSNYTNKAVNILVSTNVDQFSYMVLANGEKVESKTYTYPVTKNGTYEFIVYNKNGDYRKATIVVKNIDKEKPKGKCVITHNGGGSIITIKATDNVGIASYVYSGDKYMTNIINFDRRLESGLQMNVGFYDLAGNFSSCNCIVP